MIDVDRAQAAPRIGIYCDLRNPGAARDWHELYESTLARLAEAEREGLPSAWVTEHHGFADGYLPQPLTFCAALAARTSSLRIGTAVVLAPLLPAMAIAEQAAIVDILSNGRLELGIGAGWREEEFVAYGVDRSQRYALLEQRALALAALWASGTATPAPIQQPLPLWVGARGPRGARLAGRVGAGLLWVDRELWEPYRAGLAEGGHGAELARMAGLVNVFLADDAEQVRATIREYGRRHFSGYSGAQRGARPQATPKVEVLTPGAAAERIAEMVRGLPVTDVFCFERIGGLDEGLYGRHLELLIGTLPTLVTEALAR